jgi:hypothetical protein
MADNASTWEDYVDVFFSPATLFARRSDSRYGVAFLVFWVLMVGLFFASRSAMQPIFDAEFSRQMAQVAQARPDLKPEQLEASRKFGSVLVTIGGVVGPAVLLLLMGVITAVSGAVVKAGISFRRAMTIGVFAAFPRIVEQITNAIQLLVLPESDLKSRFSLSLGPARFLDPNHTSVGVLGLLGRIDLYTLWVTVLIAVGLKVLGKLSVGRAVAAGAVAWLVGALPTLYTFLRS